MSTALADQESVLAVRPRFSWNRLRRGDILVLRHPERRDRTFIKRIVGLPNEDVRVDSGLVYLADVLLEEPYIVGRILGRADRDGEWWTGPDEYFVLGDNRSDSQDSRAFGPVDRGLILGRVWFRCWPLRSWGPVSTERSSSI
jgi:signal peptidase I